MNYCKIKQCDIADGLGVRVSLFVSGCTHNCKGCFNKEQQNFNYGSKWTKETEEEFLGYVKNENVKIENLTIDVKELADTDSVDKVVKTVKESIYKDATSGNNMKITRRR